MFGLFRVFALCLSLALTLPFSARAVEKDAVVSFRSPIMEINVHYPVTGNAHVDADAAGWAKQTASDFQNSFGDEADSARPYDLIASYSTTSASKNTYSIIWEVATYTGGAHGNLDIVTANYDLNTGKTLDLYDVFKNLDKALQTLSEQCYTKIMRTTGDMFAEDMAKSGTAPEAENFSSFALTPSGIRIFFQPYQVAPWAAGTQIVDIPLEALKDADPVVSLWGK